MAARIRRLFAAAAVVLGFATAAAGQSTPLRGVVHDHTGSPMAGAVVTIEHPQQTAIRVVLTDLRGQYSVDRLERGTRYTVQVSHPKFRKTRVQAAAGDHVTVWLKPRRSYQAAPQQAALAERP